MELPKQMAMAELAVRALFVSFNFLSPKCNTFKYKPKKKKTIPVIVENEQAPESKLDEIKEDDRKSTASQAPSALLGLKDGGGNNRSRISMTASAASTRKGTSEQPSFIDNKSLAGDEEGKKSIIPDVNEVLLEDVEEEEEILDEDVIDLRSFSPLGPLVFVELLRLPPQQKEVNGWIMQQVVDGGLQKIPYGVELPKVDDSSSMLQQSDMSAGSNNSCEKSNSGLSYNLPIALSLRVDDHVIFHEDPQVARWDEKSQHWMTTGISDFRYEKDDRMVFFRTAYFGPFAVMQDIYLNMPFQSWQLRPIGLNECIFNICGAETEVDIIVKESKCCVRFPTEIQEVQHIADRWMTPAELIKTLRSVGINLFPLEDGEKYVSISKKLENLVHPLYKHMALSASAFSYTWSKWNNECGEEKVVVQATEWLTDDFPSEDAYALYMISTRITCKLKVNEYCEEFSSDVAAGSQMHPDIYHMLRDGGSEEAIQRLKDSSVEFIDCVHQLLEATNVLLYS